MHGSKRASTDLLFDKVLIDTVLSRTVILAVAIFGLCIERSLSKNIRESDIQFYLPNHVRFSAGIAHGP